MRKNNNNVESFQFHKDFWSDTLSEITFKPAVILPKSIPITAVKCIVLRQNRILLTKIARGWDIPSGHVEKYETAQEAILREVFEETGAKLINPKLIGYMRLYQREKNSINKKYPRLSGIAMYLCNNFRISSIPEGFESEEKQLLPTVKLSQTHCNWTEMMEDILIYARSTLKSKN